jgi:hypothetical protein
VAGGQFELFGVWPEEPLSGGRLGHRRGLFLVAVLTLALPLAYLGLVAEMIYLGY